MGPTRMHQDARVGGSIVTYVIKLLLNVSHNKVGLQENTTETEDTTPKQRSHTVKHQRKAKAVISGEVRISQCFWCLNRSSIQRKKLHDLHANHSLPGSSNDQL